ncbi:MAG: Rha family transcriptional regulator [Lachnospiraceae bacterium]|nr:Rha family transcriptional regulator [Lachnospiraceae bacterium]
MLVEIQKVNKEEVTVVTSLDIAETFGKRHDNVLKDIRVLECSREFRLLNFEESFYMNAQNKRQPMYYITRDGFALLAMGYTGEKAMKFKESYIRQFNVMEKLLKEKFVERQKGITVRHIVTDSIKRSKENERMHGHAYSLYTDMVYKALFGKNAKQLREEHGIGKSDDLRSCFTPEELQAIQSKEMLVSSLIDCGWGYGQIKAFVEQNSITDIA